jgi:hypothetical protein
VESDAWELDYVLTGSQKALALPPGLAFCTANDRIFARAKTSAKRGLYFDLLEFDEYYRKNQTPNTPATSLLFALDAQLSHIAAEGMEARWARDGGVHLALGRCAARCWAPHPCAGSRRLSLAGRYMHNDAAREEGLRRCGCDGEARLGDRHGIRITEG